MIKRKRRMNELTAQTDIWTNRQITRAFRHINTLPFICLCCGRILSIHARWYHESCHINMNKIFTFVSNVVVRFYARECDYFQVSSAVVSRWRWPDSTVATRTSQSIHQSVFLREKCAWPQPDIFNFHWGTSVFPNLLINTRTPSNNGQSKERLSSF